MDLVEEFVGMKQSIQISDWFYVCISSYKNMSSANKEHVSKYIYIYIYIYIVNKEHVFFLGSYSMNVTQVDEPHKLIWSIIIGNEDRIVSIG